MGMVWDSFSGSAGCQESSVEDEGECPPYVVVYVQSYSFVGDVSGIGMLEFGPVLHHPVNNSPEDQLEHGDAPTLQPVFGISDFDSSVAFLQQTVLYPLQCASRTEFVLPPRRFVFQFKDIVTEGHLG